MVAEDTLSEASIKQKNSEIKQNQHLIICLLSQTLGFFIQIGLGTNKVSASDAASNLQSGHMWIAFFIWKCELDMMGLSA